ncbi:DUF262 domain-containing protein [Sphingobacterium sp. BN32]|uniref:GmrSD restriction endonuclease domain-containing protein n=1 Tax=Sphingobacterium sp. BN32 TaxID=3058432 RepID=UPI00265CDC58|nr:DUF262 domain-containing protein [Sphingobacterium sp. BN32]WKK59903.1 DUF262 domain-containing protein [Sphingobacterium sp. BN32]
MDNIKEVFENKLKIDSKTVSIDSLFNNEDKLRNTNYKPSYQRNYVWDDEKATYFIESILLGTEIPPLIYFRNISKVEVIDGRQRYQTILRFINNEFKLKKSGLKKLSTKDFISKNFDSLEKKYRDLIYDTKLRIIEFSFNTKIGITDAIEDSVKKEIFKRYNSGITPLKTSEIDKADFLFDNVNDYFKKEVISDKRFFDTLKSLFHFEKFNEEILLKKIRELLVIDNIPIKYYSVKKSNIINQFYEFLFEDFESVDIKELHNTFTAKINILERVKNRISKSEDYNRLISECLFWALSIYQKEKGNLNISNSEIEKIASYIDDNIEQYIMDRSSFAIHIKNRYENVSKIFKKLFNINFNVYLKDSEVFNSQLKFINNTIDSSEVISFESLRINKPEPSSLSIDDIRRSMKKLKFIIRPQYQRNEVIDKKKASAIIESILLGIKIPPIFVYKNLDGISEVIDGQQRILSILGFLGEDFINTDNEFESTKKDDYSLNLKNSLLSDLTSKKFKDLSPEYQEKINNYDLWVVEIDKKYNDSFDPVDLFIRLNYKPYPIKIDSFEMWNSYISRDLIDSIKGVFDNNKEWFYFRKSTTRMENENILTALIYLQFQYNFSKESDKDYSALDYYKVGNRINFRLRSKPDLTKTLENEPERFIYVCNVFEADFLYKLRLLISSTTQKTLALSLDYLLCVDNGRRSQQSLYALWYFLNEIDIEQTKENSREIIKDIRSLFTQMNNVSNLEAFNSSVRRFKERHSNSPKKNAIVKIRLENVIKISKGVDKDYISKSNKKESNSELIDFYGVFSVANDKSYIIINAPEDTKKALRYTFSQSRIYLNSSNSINNFNVYLDNEKDSYVDNSNWVITLKRPGFLLEYLYLIFSSREFFHSSVNDHVKLGRTKIGNFQIPILTEEDQSVFKDLYFIIQNEVNKVIKVYFINLVNQILRFMLNSETFNLENTNLLDVIHNLRKDIDASQNDSDLLYKSLSNSNSFISSFILRMNYLIHNV